MSIFNASRSLQTNRTCYLIALVYVIMSSDVVAMGLWDLPRPHPLTQLVMLPLAGASQLAGTHRPVGPMYSSKVIQNSKRFSSKSFNIPVFVGVIWVKRYWQPFSMSPDNVNKLQLKQQVF